MGGEALVPRRPHLFAGSDRRSGAFNVLNLCVALCLCGYAFSIFLASRCAWACSSRSASAKSSAPAARPAL